MLNGYYNRSLLPTPEPDKTILKQNSFSAFIEVKPEEKQLFESVHLVFPETKHKS